MSADTLDDWPLKQGCKLNKTPTLLSTSSVNHIPGVPSYITNTVGAYSNEITSFSNSHL